MAGHISLLIKNCKLLRMGEEVIRHILVEGGKIAGISEDIPPAGSIIDARQKFVIPGAVCFDCSKQESENAVLKSYAAASGGITTLITRNSASWCGITDYGFSLFLSKESMEGLHDARNFVSSTVFMGEEWIGEPELLESIFKKSRIVAACAENEKIADAVALSKRSGAPVYLCGIGSKEEIDFLRKVKGNAIFCEASESALARGSGYIWDAINEGVIDSVGGGMGCLPVLLDAVSRKKISLQKAVELTSKNPSRIFRIRNKGALRAGFDADLVIVDFEAKKRLGTRIFRGFPVAAIVGGRLVYDGSGFYNIAGKAVSLE